MSDELLQTETEEEIQINLEEVKNAFLAGSHDLFAFVTHYDFRKEVSFADRVTLYSQLISQYEDKFKVTDQYNEKDNIAYLLVFPK